ncbi:MAG TPA: hypothetical protein VEW28_02880 [Candidatus Kapabacteria bacterium]|nr:hypothetical protein [Candidatus Kapabacteria bacterium]
MKRILLASVLGAITMFIWGFISWAVLPWHTSSIHTFSNEDAIVAAIKAGNNPSGAYMIPGFAMGHDAMVAKTEAGPVAHIFYKAEGMKAMDPMFFVKALILDILAMLVAVSLLSKISWSLASYGNRVRFMMMIGLIIAIATRLGDIVYFSYPMEFSLPMAVDEVIAWTLAGLVVAKFTKPAMAKAG